MSASSASSLGTDARAPGTQLIVDSSSRLSRYETERSVAVVSEQDAGHVKGSTIAANQAPERIVRAGTSLASTARLKS
jgi:hypothetical protein